MSAIITYFNANFARKMLYAVVIHHAVTVLGDELKVECTFNTPGHNEWVINGPGTKVGAFALHCQCQAVNVNTVTVSHSVSTIIISHCFVCCHDDKIKNI